MGFAAKGFAARKEVSRAMSLTLGLFDHSQKSNTGLIILSHMRTRLSARRQLLSYIEL
jgi:hypothetical protein